MDVEHLLVKLMGLWWDLCVRSVHRKSIEKFQAGLMFRALGIQISTES